MGNAEIVDELPATGKYGAFTCTPIGIAKIDGDPTMDEFTETFETLRHQSKGVHWCIGDLLNACESKHGQMYTQLLDGTGFDYDTLKKDKWIASKIEMCRRRHILSVSHHEAVAKLPKAEQTKWLKRAEQDQMTVSGLRTAIRTDKELRLRYPDAEHVKPSISLSSWDDWLPTQPDCDLLLTDPPYRTDVADIESFAAEWLPVALAKVKPTGRAYVCIGAYPDELSAYLKADHAGMTLDQILCWTYRNTIGPSPSHGYKLNWQAILYFRGRESPPLYWPTEENGKPYPILDEQWSVQDIAAPDGRHANRFHEWQKPDELGDRFVRHSTKPGDIVLDPFACTGTFLLSAAKHGRHGFGCDINEDHIKIAEERGCTVK